MDPERQILLAPDPVARAAARLAPEPEQRWMLRQPRDVRRSYCEAVLGADDEDFAQQVWMLHQPRAVRLDYVEQVLLTAPEPPREEIWMLRQDDAVCRDYARYVLLGDEEVAA